MVYYVQDFQITFASMFLEGTKDKRMFYEKRDFMIQFPVTFLYTWNKNGFRINKVKTACDKVT